MNPLAIWHRIRALLRAYKPRWRFCVRMTASGLAAYAVAKILQVPLHGLWVIITAVVVTQMSAGGSLRATLEYVIGTVGGAVYAAIIGVLIPHATPLAEAGVLALVIAPLALLAAFNPNFRVAPFSAVLVILIAGQFGEGPIESAIIRSSEVALGGVIAVIVSLLVFPERAHQMRLKAAVRLLQRLARDLPLLLTGFTGELDPATNSRIQNDIGAAVASFQQITKEAQHELLVTVAEQPDPGPLSRTMLRLRHDLVIIGRAGVRPLPNPLRTRLSVPLTRVGAAASDFLNDSANALSVRSKPPPLDAFEAALATYTAEVEALRSAGLTLPLTSNEVEPVFALGFALDQLHENFFDLQRCVRDYAQRPRRKRSNEPSRRSG
ncbi:MAG: FUSC family protein [Xanthobacteraceae bacterium]